ncbi:hypothetical protein FRC06_010634, partial [Ceratobasidium sp. 370]
LGNPDDFDQAIDYLDQVVSLTPEDGQKRLQTLMTLGPLHLRPFTRLCNPEDLENAIDCFSRANNQTPDGHSDKLAMNCHLGDLHRARFQRLGELTDIDKSLGYQMLALSLTPDRSPMKTELLRALGRSLELRYKSLGKREDAEPALFYYQQAAWSPGGYPTTNLSAARLSSSFFASSSLKGYGMLVSLLPQVFWIGNTEINCYESEFNIEDITTEVVAAAISSQSYDLAVEWFDTCRRRAWKETLQLRQGPLADLRSLDPHLADHLEQIAHELDQSNESGGPHPTSAELVRAARSGAVVVVNAHGSCCDALVIHPGRDTISHLAKILGNQDLPERKCQTGCDSERIFEEILGTLWDDVVKPVLDNLGYEPMPPTGELPHIPWCLAGQPSGLPLHAAGQYNQSQAKVYHYVSSSYAPSLSALLAKPPNPGGFDGILTVGQIAANAQEGLPSVAEATGRHVTELVGDQSTAQNVLSEMAKHGWVHLGC